MILAIDYSFVRWTKAGGRRILSVLQTRGATAADEANVPMFIKAVVAPAVGIDTVAPAMDTRDGS